MVHTGVQGGMVVYPGCAGCVHTQGVQGGYIPRVCRVVHTQHGLPGVTYPAWSDGCYIPSMYTGVPYPACTRVCHTRLVLTGVPYPASPHGCSLPGMPLGHSTPEESDGGRTIGES